ncbi:hypothetical protein KFK09_003661 [Dendrobium nobile]|uniref:RNase H type-1 domain-containing protein n=1 Tax=Dendrobium nobile TaxID=94219 RepID=A0A8T3C366_DENNO|nr:hypothetical protein KFK09_003661 [Dendrobium nobile]
MSVACGQRNECETVLVVSPVSVSATRHLGTLRADAAGQRAGGAGTGHSGQSGQVGQPGKREEEPILQSGVDHFYNIFNKEINQEGILNPYIVPRGISDTDNLHLSMLPSEDEMWKVMQAMNGDSVAGPDGFTTTFFIKTWHIIKKDILDAICDFFSDLCVKLGMSIHLEDAIRRERIVRWLKPKAPAIKLNSDGSVDNFSAGFGGIIRDSFGKVIVAFAGPLPPCMVIYAELMGLLKGLNICIKRGFIYVEIEVDALNVIQIINSTHISYPQFFYLIREIKSALSNLNFTLAHLLREGNACADALAKLGSTLEEEREFDMENLPRLRLQFFVNLGCYFEIGRAVFLLEFKFLGYISLKAYLRATFKLLDQVGILNNCKEDGAEC